MTTNYCPQGHGRLERNSEGGLYCDTCGTVKSLEQTIAKVKAHHPKPAIIDEVKREWQRMRGNEFDLNVFSDQCLRAQYCFNASKHVAHAELVAFAALVLCAIGANDARP